MSPGEKMIYAAAFVAYLHDYEGHEPSDEAQERARVAAAQTVMEFREAEPKREPEENDGRYISDADEFAMYKAMRYGS